MTFLHTFSHTVTTTAAATSIWTIWADVSRWAEWDTELDSARLEGDFRLGATGKLTPKKGPQSKFVISQLVDGESYTFTTQLPFCKLHVARFLCRQDSGTSFTHEVSFDGLLSVVFAKLLGKRFQLVLPGVMQNIKRMAES